MEKGVMWICNVLPGVKAGQEFLFCTSCMEQGDSQRHQSWLAKGNLFFGMTGITWSLLAQDALESCYFVVSKSPQCWEHPLCYKCYKAFCLGLEPASNVQRSHEFLTAED